MTTPIPRLRLFYSYAHADEELRDELEKHLSNLRNQGVIEEWHDRRIIGGAEWAGEIDEHLERADIILLLVSADFLVSKYCYAIEMKRALERHKQKESRVVPVILRPVDWEGAPFAGLQALPKNGRPVTEWPNRDAAFQNVAKGIRKVAEELAAGPALPETGEGEAPPTLLQRMLLWLRSRRGSRWTTAAVGAAIVLAVGGGLWWRAYQRPLALGRDFLNVGRYVQARTEFERARRINPLGRDASWGLEVVSVQLSEQGKDATPEDFAKRVEALGRRRPDDPYVTAFRGDLAAVRDDYPAAQTLYSSATVKMPGLAEAWFKRGILFEKRKDWDRAEAMYTKALALSEENPRYRGNLAWLLAQGGRLDDALQEYGKISASPNAAMDAAKICWARNDYARAAALQQQALEWLGTPRQVGVPEELEPWNVAGGGALYETAEKVCYGRLSLAASHFLRGDEATARNRRDEVSKACPNAVDIPNAVVSDLKWASEHNPSLKGGVDAWERFVAPATGLSR